MLKRPLLRSLALRQFSTSSAIWIPQKPVTTRLPHEEQSTSTSLPQNKAEESHEDRLSTESRATGSGKSHTTGARGSLSPYDVELVKKRIQAWTAQTGIALRHRADDFTAITKTTFSQLGSQLNHVTGYEEIEALKRGVVEQERIIDVARQAARKAKVAYEEAVVQRSKSQRDVNDLLQRKSTWSDSDVGRFTSLVKQDHLYEQEETRAKAAVEETEEVVERELSQLLRKILARYHEEQVWSDKIRSASTYGSLAALGLNMLVFILAIVVVEPWKRQRLAQTFERKIEQLSSENEARLNSSMESIGQQMTEQRLLLEALKEEARNEEYLAPTVRESIEQEPKEKSLEIELSVIIQSWKPSRQQIEMAAVGVGAFAIGILTTVVLGR